MHGRRMFLAAVVLALSGQAQESAGELLERARAAFGAGQVEEASRLAGRAVERDPDNPRGYLMRGSIAEARGRYREAVADYSEAIRRLPGQAGIYNRRGGANFKLGEIEASIADFDEAIRLDPSQEPHHWQRGISYYYAKRYRDGARQFEIHQTVNPSDVENAVWHFICKARAESLEAARQELLPIPGDSRVPMMQIYALFGGKGTVAGVLEAAEAGNPSAEALNQRLMYAHLYLGLYYEATGDAAAARRHILEAAKHKVEDHYMWDVARVHAERLGR
jgi:lipoprotein NlpI